MTSSERSTPPAGSASSGGSPPPAKTPPQIAVWYFVAATFVFASSTIWFPDAGLWGRLVIMALGMLLVVLGGIRLGREITAHRSATTPPPAGPEVPPAT